MVSAVFTISIFVASVLRNQVTEGLLSHGSSATNGTSSHSFIDLSVPVIELRKSRSKNDDEVQTTEDNSEVEFHKTAFGMQNPTIADAFDRKIGPPNLRIRRFLEVYSTIKGGAVKPTERSTASARGQTSSKNPSLIRSNTSSSAPNNETNIHKQFGAPVVRKERRPPPPRNDIFNRSRKPDYHTDVKNIVRLCAFSPYSDPSTCLSQNYTEDPLSQCERTWALLILASVATIMGVAILSINALIPLVVFSDRKMRTQYYAIKVSLAFADMTLGLLLLGALIPNIFRIRNLTEEKAAEFIIEHANSPDAIIAGSLLTVSKQASLLHLMFLSVERFVAIKWPLWHVGRNASSVAAILIAIWVISIFSAFIPAAFPAYFAYQFQPAILLHMLTLQLQPAGADKPDWRGPLYASFTLFLPYAITVIFSIMTGIVSYRKLQSTAECFGKNQVTLPRYSDESEDHSATNIPENDLSGNGSRNKRLPPEIAVFVTLLLMIAAFTVTLLPFTIVTILFITKTLDCGNYVIPYTTSFYIAVLNSLANALIYSVRDDRFRSSVQDLPASMRSLLQTTKAR